MVWFFFMWFALVMAKIQGRMPFGKAGKKSARRIRPRCPGPSLPLTGRRGKAISKKTFVQSSQTWKKAVRAFPPVRIIGMKRL